MRRRGFLASLGLGISALCAPVLAWAQTARASYLRLQQGPMIGATTSTSISIWLRAANAAEVHIEYDTDPHMAEPKRSAPASVNDSNDFTRNNHADQPEAKHSLLLSPSPLTAKLIAT